MSKLEFSIILSFRAKRRISATPTLCTRCFSLRIDDADAEMLNKLESDCYFDGDETQKIFLKAIHGLPEKQQMIFNLKYFKEMKYEEISEILGTSIGALKASYHHAVKKIESFLEKHL